MRGQQLSSFFLHSNILKFANLPNGLGSYHSIENCKQLPHARYQCYFLGLASLQQVLVKGHNRISPDSRAAMYKTALSLARATPYRSFTALDATPRN